MKAFPKTDNSLLLRTDFSDDAAWKDLCESVQQPSEDGFMAYVDCIDDPAYHKLTIEQLLDLANESDRSFVFIADRATFTNLERPVLVIDLYEELGRTFRVVPREMWNVENNLSISNMDFYEFADAVDADGVFRGFPAT